MKRKIMKVQLPVIATATMTGVMRKVDQSQRPDLLIYDKSRNPQIIQNPELWDAMAGADNGKGTLKAFWWVEFQKAAGGWKFIEPAPWQEW